MSRRDEDEKRKEKTRGEERRGEERRGEERREEKRREEKRREREQNRREQNRREQNRTEQKRREENRTEQKQAHIATMMKSWVKCIQDDFWSTANQDLNWNLPRNAIEIVLQESSSETLTIDIARIY